MKYKIIYSYDGFGEAFVEANSPMEAEEEFYNGNAIFNDDGQEYKIEEVLEEEEEKENRENKEGE
jgi:hypothetical protein